MDQLKLIALDTDDLAVVSAHLQDGILKVRDMLYMPREKRFALIVRRFDWAGALGGAGNGGEGHRRRQSALRFERVRKAQHCGIDLAALDAVLSLLAVRFERKGPEDPSGQVTLVFSGNAAVRLEVECIEAELKDLGPVWRARSRPEHPDDPEGAGDAAADGDRRR